MTLRRWLSIALLLAPGMGLIVLMIGTVVFIAIAQSFGYYNLSGDSAFSLDFWSTTLERKVVVNSIRYSLYIGVVSAFLSVALAYPLAIWLRKPFAGSMTIGAILKAPLLVHGLVAAFLYVNVIAYHGILNQFMQYLGIWSGPRRLQNDNNAVGVLLLQVWKQMPFALLLLTGSVRGISDDVLDAARDLGAGTWARFRRVIAPLTLSGMQASLTIIFIGALSDFSFQVIAGPNNRQSLAQLMNSYKDRGDWNSAAVVGVTLMLLALIGSVVLAYVTRVIMRGKLR
jgi:putative spermidine/putrescine transport system permease protein